MYFRLLSDFVFRFMFVFRFLLRFRFRIFGFLFAVVTLLEEDAPRSKSRISFLISHGG